MAGPGLRTFASLSMTRGAVTEKIVKLPGNWLCHHSVNELVEVQDQQRIRRERLALRQKPIGRPGAMGFAW